MTLGKVQDIEELGVKVVLCPWHKFMVNIRTGVKVHLNGFIGNVFIFYVSIEIGISRS